MKPICVVGGGGYVGLGSAVDLAQLGTQDPAALANAATRLPNIELCDDLYVAAVGVDAVALCAPGPSTPRSTSAG